MEKKFQPEQLKKIREVRGISAYDLADIIDMAPTAIYNYEKGIRTPSYETILLLSSALNTSPNYFYGEDIEYYTAKDYEETMKRIKVSFNLMYNQLRDITMKRGKVDQQYIDLINLLDEDRSNLNGNAVIRLLNYFEFLNISLDYLMTQTMYYPEPYENVTKSNELNKNDFKELFYLIDSMSRLGFLKMLMTGKEILKQEKEILDLDTVSEKQEARIAKLVEGAVTQRRMQGSSHYSDDEITEYISSNYESTDLMHINKILGTEIITAEIKNKFDKFLDKAENEELL